MGDLHGFEWDSPEDCERNDTLSKLIKFSDGLYKSDRQGGFIRNSWRRRSDTRPEWMQECFGVKVGPGQFVVEVEGRLDFGGVRGRRPVLHMYVCDSIGVVARYRVPYRGDMRQGTGPDPKRTTLLWSRPEHIQPPPVVVKPIVTLALKAWFAQREGLPDEITGTIERQTEKALLIGWDRNGYATETWIPKSALDTGEPERPTWKPERKAPVEIEFIPAPWDEEVERGE